MKKIILVNKKGKQEFQLPLPDQRPAWVVYDGRLWRFGVAQLNGEFFYYEVDK